MPSFLTLAALKQLPWRLIGWCALGFTFAALLLALRMEQLQNGKLKAQLHECTVGRQADRTSYQAAQTQAAELNRAHVETENKLREQINEASRHSFVADRDRLRSQSGAAKGPASAAGVSEVPHAAPGTPSEVVSLPPAELLRAQETELQLNALIDWINQQSQVAPSER